MSGCFEGRTFVHRTIATYGDTNSVGNIYFARYALFVGKTRELFFNAVMPGFDLRNTPFLILTRDYRHRFLREAREFDVITTRIRIASHNQHFCTLEHEILGPGDETLGEGSQRIYFISVETRTLIEIPPPVLAAFIPYLPETARD